MFIKYSIFLLGILIFSIYSKPTEKNPEEGNQNNLKKLLLFWPFVTAQNERRTQRSPDFVSDRSLRSPIVG
jgi:hypothetical protein